MKKSIGTKPILSSVKIGRKEYQVKTGDYILYNGASYQFCSGDGRTLEFKGYNQYANLRLPALMVKEIPFFLFIFQIIFYVKTGIFR